MNSEISRQDRIKGVMYGVALGDALGMPTEFMTRAEITEEFGRVEEFISAPPWHPLADLPPGSITDDTEQTLAIAELVKDNPDFSPKEVAETMLDWAEKSLGFEITQDSAEKLNKMGPSTLKALASYARGEDLTRTGLTGNTNGAAIRVSPVALAYPETPPELAQQVLNLCIPTHCTEVAVAGSCAVAYWISRALSGASKEEAWEAAIAGVKRGKELFRNKIEIDLSNFSEQKKWMILSQRINPDLEARISWAGEMVKNNAPDSEAERRKIYEKLLASLGTGVNMIETVPLALALTWLARDPYEAIILGANSGGDTDSIASITGGLAGSLGGMSAFPPKLITELENCNDMDLADLAADFY